MLERSFLESLVEAASLAACLAGDQALTAMSQARATLKQGTTGEELVTQLDKLSQDRIIASLREHFPDHGFLGEEGDESGGIFKQAPTGNEAVWWIIDPIDGTNNFARGLDLFAVSIGAMVNGYPVAGVIYHPATQSLYSGTRGGAALLNGNPIQCGNDPMSLYTNVAIDSHYGDRLPTWFHPIIQRSRFRTLGSAALHLAYTAKGGMIGTIICQGKLWDIAAGAVLAEGCGAIMTDHLGKPLWPLDMEHYDGHALPCVMANPKAHQEIMALMGT